MHVSHVTGSTLCVGCHPERCGPTQLCSVLTHRGAAAGREQVRSERAAVSLGSQLHQESTQTVRPGREAGEGIQPPHHS